MAVEQGEDAQRRLAEVSAKAQAEREENQANIVALIKELEESRARATKLEGEVEAAKLKGAEEFQTSAAFKDLELKWKQEAYYAGVDTNFQLLTYYKALDLPKFLAASEDPVAQASAPRETYAEQWGHLVPPAEDEVNEGADVELP